MRVISPSAKAATNVGEITRVVGLRTAFFLLIGGLPGLRPMSIPSGSTELGLDLTPDCRRRLRGRSSRWVTSKKEAARTFRCERRPVTLPLRIHARSGARKYSTRLRHGTLNSVPHFLAADAVNQRGQLVVSL